MTQEEASKRWRESAQEDLDTAETLFTAEKFAHCLFFCHLAVEKMLKAVYTRKADDAPPIEHHLGKLWKKANVPLGPATGEILSEMSTFNVEARYDIYKQRLYKKATEAYTRRFLVYTREYILWLNRQF